MDGYDSLRDTTIPKSDQLNADDLIGTTITVRITGVSRGTNEQPISINIEGQRPYKPCKSMRRVLIAAWGDNGADWVGNCMTLYADPEVKFGGVKVGGIRISHLTGITQPLELMLTETRAKRKPYHVEVLNETQAAASTETKTAYPQETFEQNYPKWESAIEKGTHTVSQIITGCMKKGALSDEQIDSIEALGAN